MKPQVLESDISYTIRTFHCRNDVPIETMPWTSAASGGKINRDGDGWPDIQRLPRRCSVGADKFQV